MWLNHCALIVAALLPLAETAANDNAAAHRVYCGLLTAATTPYTTSDLNDDPSTAFNTILAMNFSTSSNDWKTVFDTSTDEVSPKNPPDGTAPPNDKEAWQKMWPEWWAAGRCCVTEKIVQGDKPAYPAIRQPEQKRQAHRELQKLIDGTQPLLAAYDNLKSELKSAKTKLNGYLTEALIGEKSVNNLPTAGNGIAALSTWSAGCGENLPGKSIAGDFLCACNNNADTTKQCSPLYTPHTWTSNIDLNTKWPLLKSSCKEPLPAALTAAAIHQALATFDAQLQHKNNAGTKHTILGLSDDHQCTGAAAKLCVDYTAYFDKTTGHTATKIPWKDKLEKAAAAITELEAKALEGRNLERQIQANSHVCQGIYAAVAQGTLVDNVISAISPLKPSTTDILEATCNNLTTNTTCTPPCTWHDKESDPNKKCKLDPKKAAEQQATRAGKDGDQATTTEKCKGKLEPEWTKTPECKWENNACKDYSCLSSKKFTLMAAAFVSLVAF